MQALMMVTALAWPMLGGALVGLIGGIARRHGLFGTLLDVVLGGVIGFALTMAFVTLAGGAIESGHVILALTLGLPVVGGLLALWLRARFSAA